MAKSLGCQRLSSWITIIDSGRQTTTRCLRGAPGGFAHSGFLAALVETVFVAGEEMSGNFYKGTTKEQTPFFKDKDTQLIAQRKVRLKSDAFKHALNTSVALL